MAFWYKKLILAVLLLSLEIISFVLDQIGGSNRPFRVASFLLSAIGFVTTIYTSFFSSTVSAVTRSEPERQLIALDIVFSFIQLVFTYIQMIMVFLGAKSNNNNECLLPLAFAVISVVFNFRNNEEAQVVSDSTSVNQNDEEAQVVSDNQNNKEAQVVSDSASVSQIISTETPAFVDESPFRRVPSTLLRHRQHKQKVVIKVSMKNYRSRSKALEIVSGASGVESAKLKGDDRSQIVVTGEGFDPMVLTQMLRMKVGYAELVSVEEKQEEKKENEAKAMPAYSYHAPLTYVDEYPYNEQNNCSIM